MIRWGIMWISGAAQGEPRPTFTSVIAKRAAVLATHRSQGLRDHPAAGKRHTVHRGDRRLGNGNVVAWHREHVAWRHAELSVHHFLQIAGTEGFFAGAGQDGNTQGGIMLETIPGGKQALSDIQPKRIAALRPIERDDGDAVIARFEQHCVSHQKPLSTMAWAARSSSSRKSGWAMATSRFARSPIVRPFSSAAPNSVTITSTSLRAVVTGPVS